MSTVILCTGKLPTWWVSSSELAWAPTSCPLTLTPNAETPRWPHHMRHQWQPRRPLPEEFMLTIRFFHWPLLSQCFSDLDTRESRPVHPPPSGPVLSETTSLSHRWFPGIRAGLSHGLPFSHCLYHWEGTMKSNGIYLRGFRLTESILQTSSVTGWSNS